MAKYYLASSLNNVSRVRHLASELALAGYKRTYDWTTHGFVEDSSKLQEIAFAEYNGVVEADFLVMLMPARTGSHVEFGVALALGKPIYIIIDGHEYEEKSFYNMPKVSKYQDIKSFIEGLQNEHNFDD